MAELGQLVAKSLVQKNLAWRIVDVIVAAEHVGDALVMVVADHGQVVGRPTIGPAG